MSQRILDVRRPGLKIDGEDSEQHQHRAEQRVKKKLESRIDPVRAAPHPDNQEHRDQHAFEEHIEQDEIEGAKNSDHQGLEHEEGDHEFLDAELDHFPGGDDGDERQDGRQQHKEQGDAVDPHVIIEIEAAEGDPTRPLDKLKVGGAGIEIEPQHE